MRRRSRPSFAHFVLVATFAVALATAPPAAAQGHGHGDAHGERATLALRPNLCPVPVAGQPLEQPKNIRADRYGVLQTEFVVDIVQFACLPEWQTDHWAAVPARLRTYGTPREDDPEKLEWVLPGPTLRARKTYLADPTKPPGPDNPVVERGTRVNLRLVNKLPNSTYPYDECLPKTVTQTSASNTCPDPPCTFVEEAPECFHGSEVTNLHYHGTHVSPQPHQDFVLLNLYSAEQTDPPPPPEDEYNQVGDYHYSIDPFPWNQAPGTHWYHPHKHGSTALQVANGMSGALIIQGPFDDWLYDLYDVDSTNPSSLETFEKILIVQQLQQDLNFYRAGVVVNQPTVNGQATPVVQMYPGEVQRWRFVGATVKAAGSLNVAFPQQVVVRQIAQDGVQFASENYRRQPFVTKTQRTITRLADGSSDSQLESVDFNNYVLSPGNRADFLVKAPVEPGDYDFTFELVHQNLAEEVNAPFATRGAADPRKATLAAAAGTPDLFTVRVVAGPPRQLPLPVPNSDPRCAETPRPKVCWPETPYYLRDLGSPGETRQVAFSMTEPDGQVTKQGQQRNTFWINDMQYMADCAGETMELGSIQDWNVTNDSPLGHPFHIHINPFQVLDYPNFPDIATNGPPYPWMDTIPLPVGDCDPQGKCEKVGARIRHAFEDFTGGYVIHCHFLGHEDRGMMLNVQTVCPDSGDPGLWGRPETAGPDNCRQTRAALPICKSKY